MSETLHRIIYGRPTAEDETGSALQLLAKSSEVTAEEASLWRSRVTLDPLDAPAFEASQAAGIFSGTGRNFLLARAHHQNDDLQQTAYELLPLPRKLLEQMSGRLEPLFILMTEPIPDFDQPLQSISPVELPPVLPWTREEQLARLKAALETFAENQFDRLLMLLGAAIDSRRLLIRAFPGLMRDRFALVQGLMALLPSAARPDLTFSTHSRSAASDVCVLFSESPGGGRQWIVDWRTRSFPLDVLGRQPYISLLQKLWHGDVSALVETLVSMDGLADHLMAGLELKDGLDRITEQVELDQRVVNGADVAASSLKRVLTSSLPLAADVRRRYSERLMQHALEARDTEAALIVALEMDEDTGLDSVLSQLLDEALNTQPDSVYVFVRTRLNDAMEVDPRWLERLKVAAQQSVNVAVNNADGETILNWLRLLAREPAAYQLGDVLRHSILTAQARAHEDGELARQLLVLTVKRDPQIIDQLLDDTALVKALPENMGQVIREYAGQPLLTLQRRGPEMFLVAMARAARARAVRQFNVETINQVWRLYAAGQNFNLPDHYRPESVVTLWVSEGAEWLDRSALESILTLTLADGRDELFYRFAHHLAEHEKLMAILPSALQNSQRNVNDLLTLMNQLLLNGDLFPQQAVDTTITLLDLREWRQAALPLVEHISRLIQQHSDLEIPLTTVWNLLDIAARSRAEPIARLAARQIFNDIERQDGNEAALVEMLLPLLEQVQWSQNAQYYIFNWWRSYIRLQPLARLGRIDKQLEGKRTLDDLRVILQTALAFQRMLGKRSLYDFAQVMKTALAVLSDISESFDPSPKNTLNFDMETIRAELSAREAELSNEERKILARNFKDLAQLIGEMGDQRSKANLMRRGDNIDRQLMTGEQQPVSAVDAMKWMSGYLDGVQSKGDADNE